MKLQELEPVNATYPEQGGVRGAIVTLGSVASIWSPPGMAQYCAAKHAVLSITKTVGKYMNGAHRDPGV